MILSLSSSVSYLITSSGGGDDFFENIDFVGDEFFGSYIINSIIKDITREAREVVYNYFNSEIN
jgi:hypothetical protein